MLLAEKEEELQRVQSLEKLRERMDSSLEPQEDGPSSSSQLQTFMSYSVVSVKSKMKTLADLSSAEVHFLVRE